MDNSKYYTPEIEEFHVGFECESYYNSKWNKEELDSEWLGSLLLEESNNKDFNLSEFRVKYLDKKDIESLGWEIDYGISYKDDELVELFSTTKNKDEWYHLEIYDNIVVTTKNKIYDEISGNWDQELIFKGTIKNKSELKQIMKQLNMD